MSLTLLIDLDNTLLTNSVETFVPAYMKALSDYMAPFINPDRFFGALLAATRKMLQNRDPECYLKDAFDANFYPQLGVTPEDLRPPLERFYAEVFPTLRPLTKERPEAIRLVENALDRGYRIAIATNPLFPLTAIEQRLTWAGLSPERYPFAFVPSYESVHFAKPDPAFLAELLAYLGWSKEPVVMIGDDLENDIRCADDLGVPSYLVDGHPTEFNPRLLHGAGSLTEFLPWVDATTPDHFHTDFATPIALQAILRSTPAAIQSLSRKLKLEQWNIRIQPKEWSQTEILCHLRDVETEVNLPRLEKVVQETNPFIPGQDTDRWAEERTYISQNGEQALGQFIASRKKLLALLAKLQPEDWQRTARHAIFGPTTLHELVRIISGHDQLHIQQLHSLVQSFTQAGP